DFVERSAAVGADGRQGRLVNLVDLFRGRWLAVRLGAVILARLAAGLVGLWLGRGLGEGGGLSVARTEGVVELAAGWVGSGLAAELLVLGLQVVDSSPKGLAVGTPNRFHTRIIRSGGTCSCSEGG